MQIRSISILAIGLFFCHTASAQTDDATPNPASVVISDKARFTILTDRVIRMEYAANSKFTDEASLTFVNRHLPAPLYQVSDNKGWLTIKAKYLTLHYQKNSGEFSAENLYIEYRDTNHLFVWRPDMKDEQNLKGTTRTLDGAMSTSDAGTTEKVSLEDGIISRSGWAVIDDSKKPVFDHSDWPWVQKRKAGEAQDIYFFGYGSDYKAAMYDFTLIGGRMSLPPRYAFGVWYSRYWAYTEQDMKDIVAGYQQHDLPLDVLVIDMDWHLTRKSSPEMFKHYPITTSDWTGFTWEKKYFPDYREFLAWTDSLHIQTCMNLHPAAGVQAQEEVYPAFAKAMGINPASKRTVHFNITDKKFAQNYFDILLHPYEKAGVDFWWLDWQQQGGTKIKGVNSTFYLNYVHFSDMQRRGMRPLIFHRWGGLGNLRYQIGFSGDYTISWPALEYQPTFTATAANVGFGFWSHDLGGHMNWSSKADKQDAELFTRWLEWGAFSPIFRTHATNDPTIERRMWKYPEANLKAMHKALHMRYALLPYIYTMARAAYDSGISIVHPMYYEYPETEKAYQADHQYYFGSSMIVSPITRPMNGGETITQTVWLPAGKWYDFRNNEMVNGDKDVTSLYTLDEIPVYVKAGSIIPMQTHKLRIAGSVQDTLILTVYAGQSGSFAMYEDEGNTEGYRKDQYSFTHMTWTDENGAGKFKIEPDGKTFAGQLTERSYQIHIVSSRKPTQVKVNGQNADWVYDDKNKLILFSIPKLKIATLNMEIL